MADYFVRAVLVYFSILFASCLQLSAALQWQVKVPVYGSPSGSSIAFGQGRFVKVSGHIYNSIDGRNWTGPYGPLNTFYTNALHSVVFGGGSFTVVGDIGAIWSSTNGLDWITNSSPTTNNLLAQSVSPDLSVIVGAQGTILISTNRTDWEQANSGTASNLFSVVNGGGVLVAAGDNGLLTSTNGFDWIQAQTPTNAANLSVAYGNGIFVAAGEWPMVSTNGADWMLANTNFWAGHVQFIEDRFVASSDGSSWFYESTNGFDWNQVLGMFPSSDVCVGNGLYVGFGHLGWGLTTYTSDSPLKWNNRSSPQFLQFYDIDFGQNVFVAVGTGGEIYTSNDGADWALQASGTSELIHAVTCVHGMFIATSSSQLLRSTDGTNWISSPQNTNYVINTPGSITYGNNQFIAVSGKRVLTSPDAVNWTPVFTTTNILNSVAYGNNLFVATTRGQKNWYLSTDGTNWTGVPGPAFQNYYRIMFAEGRFVAVSYNCGACSSRDGTNWIEHWRGNYGYDPDVDFFKAAYGQGYFLAVGVWSTLLIGNDTYLSSFPGYGSGVAFGNGRFVAVGGVSIYQSDEIRPPPIRMTGSVTIPSNHNGGFRLATDDAPGRFYHFQSSSNLVNWSDVTLVTNQWWMPLGTFWDTNGWVTNGFRIKQRYFRVVSP